MDVQASPAELPELKDFLGAVQVRFRRPAGGASRGAVPDGTAHGAAQ
jgi:hypothetical protein